MYDHIKEALIFIGIMVPSITALVGAIYWAIRQAIKRGRFMQMFKQLVEEVTNIKDMLGDFKKELQENRERHRATEKEVSDLNVRTSKLEVVVFDTINTNRNSPL